MVLVSEKCAQILNCRISALRNRLNHPADRARIMAFLDERMVRTTYEDRNGFKKTFSINGLTQKGADSLMAFGKLPRPYAVCVAAYYYAKHRIKLHFPYHVCVIEKFPEGAEDRYFPLELLELIEEEPTPFPGWFGRNLFAELPLQEPQGNDEQEDPIDNWGRDECTQDAW